MAFPWLAYFVSFEALVIEHGSWAIGDLTAT